MKKKVFFASVALIAAVSTAIGIHSADCGQASSLKLANIEALSKEEAGTECRWSRKIDEFGCVYHKCEKGGEGYLCHCGDIV